MTPKPKRKEQFVPEEMDDDLLLADFQGSQLHVLNPTAAAVWEMCDGQSTAEQMAGQLAAQFALSPDQVQGDVAKILAEFWEKGLVE